MSKTTYQGVGHECALVVEFERVGPLQNVPKTLIQISDQLRQSGFAGNPVVAVFRGVDDLTEIDCFGHNNEHAEGKAKIAGPKAYRVFGFSIALKHAAKAAGVIGIYALEGLGIDVRVTICGITMLPVSWTDAERID